jgi:hypothetical protein
MMHQLDNLIEQLRALGRFRWIGMAVAWAVLLVALTVITILPNRYEASATVFVNTQTAVGAATRTLTIDENMESQIQLVREALLGGSRLLPCPFGPSAPLPHSGLRRLRPLHCLWPVALPLPGSACRACHLHSPPGLLRPSGSKRSTAFAACRST